MNSDQNIVLRGERELAERAGPLFAEASKTFVCAATDMKTWVMPGVREQIAVTRRTSADWPAPYKLYTPQALADEESERHLVELERHGARVRICQAPIPHETIVIDDRVAILAGEPVRGVREYTVVRTPGVVAGVLSLYWATWENSTDLTDYRRTRPPALSDQSREILRMLGSGLKDERAAPRLGLSLRTYRRRVAEILTLLDADSRFQAGLRAHEFGLIN
ncbi:helix-turn-helix transcriptional regulator [Actinomadura hibisca]|uniref:helix-turn-helix transcriptional regulator n=1 Tax=Actinomadura hibisca TaxID=68565 RepID=UPI0008328F9D|nr:response regulator transcription factor [Actinomadura hibisca]